MDGEVAILGQWLVPGIPMDAALAIAAAVAFVATLVAMPRVIRKLLGAGIVGQDINKPTRPVVAEMGGIGVFLGFNTGVFAFLALFPLDLVSQTLVLVALITAAGAALTGVIDDLVELRQRFKAFIPVVFAAPLAIFVRDYAIAFPLLGSVDFGVLYPFLLVPIGVACAANGFNMLEGYNGLGTGIGIVSAATLSLLAVLEGRGQALVLLLPLLGALLAFLWYNRYPAQVFPGDTLTLLVGAVLATGAIVGKVEFWGALLFIPHVAEFFLKARGQFEGENFAKRIVANPHGPPVLGYEGRTESLTHVVLRRKDMTEPRLVLIFWSVQFALSVAVVAAYLLTK